MVGLVRFGVSMDAPLAKRFDKLMQRRGYHNRSEAIRDMVRRELVRQEWEEPDTEIVGTVTLLYDHHVRQAGDQLTALQHQHHDEVISATHVHLTHEHCLEVLVVRGRARQVQALADQLIASRGVLHGELVASTSGAIFEKESHGAHHH
jgi:CopG family nickel-responsive transcriptional regulator